MKAWGVGLVLLAAVAGCSRNYTVIANQQPANTASYVLVQTSARSGKQKIYDCRSSPDGVTWAPECREVKK